MNHRKQDPVGIDGPIDTIQRIVYGPLSKLWGEIEMYGRVYKKAEKDGISLERYIGDGEYEKVLFNEGNKVFFVQGKKPEMEDARFSNDLYIVSIVDIERISGTQHRADEEVHLDMVSELSKVIEPDNILGLEYGMDNLKRVVEDVFEFGNFKYSDIQPYHVFMVRCKVSYSLIKNEC